MKRMPDDTVWIYGAVGIILVLLFLLVNLFLYRDKEEPIVPVSVSESTVESETSSSSNDTNAIETEFEKIEFGLEDTMEGRSGFFDLTEYQEGATKSREALDLVPVTEGNVRSYSGHQIYHSQTNDRDYIISGTIPIPVDNKDDYSGNGFLREEDTGKLIHVFGNASDAESFLKQFEEGQKILNGTEESEEGMVIIDGSLTPYSFRRSGSSIYINLEEIVPLVSTMTYYDETMGYMTVYVNDFVSVMLLTNSANESLQATFNTNGRYFQFSSWNGERFECWIPLLDAITPELDIEYASQMFGWQFYTDGKALSIVTDPLNVSDLVAIRDLGDSGITIHMETGEDGKRYACAYDSFGTLVWKTEVTEEDYATEETESGSEATSESSSVSTEQPDS